MRKARAARYGRHASRANDEATLASEALPDLRVLANRPPVLLDEGYLRRETASGVLDVRRPALAATQFLEMVKGDLHFRALLGSEPLPSKKEVGACVREATHTFLSGIARRGRDLPHTSPGPSRSRSDRASSKPLQPR